MWFVSERNVKSKVHVLLLTTYSFGFLAYACAFTTTHRFHLSTDDEIRGWDQEKRGEFPEPFIKPRLELFHRRGCPRSTAPGHERTHIVPGNFCLLAPPWMRANSDDNRHADDAAGSSTSTLPPWQSSIYIFSPAGHYLLNNQRRPKTKYLDQQSFFFGFGGGVLLRH